MWGRPYCWDENEWMGVRVGWLVDGCSLFTVWTKYSSGGSEWLEAIETEPVVSFRKHFLDLVCIWTCNPTNAEREQALPQLYHPAFATWTIQRAVNKWGFLWNCVVESKCFTNFETHSSRSQGELAWKKDGDIMTFFSERSRKGFGFR